MSRLSVQTVVFGVISVVSLPGGVFFGWLGVDGALLDASYRENVLAGVALFLFGLVPPGLALASWICDQRGPERREFEVRSTRDREQAG